MFNKSIIEVNINKMVKNIHLKKDNTLFIHLINIVVFISVIIEKINSLW